MKTPNSSLLTPPSLPQEALGTLKLLTTPEQYEVITDAMLGEEGDHFIAIIDRIHATWQAMPKTYESVSKRRINALYLFSRRQPPLNSEVGTGQRGL